jgi:hypothetical protein
MHHTIRLRALRKAGMPGQAAHVVASPVAGALSCTKHMRLCGEAGRTIHASGLYRIAFYSGVAAVGVLCKTFGTVPVCQA